ncbi:hypothetical protein BC629DRAFT_1541086 [Irpex lacteus]|nr:hypothetical protein BC629DRAFT_1541086 [Irpex lacteus]
MGLAATVYAEQLRSYGYGHPLWFPEPMEASDGRVRGIELGDVGYFDEDGGFKSLFNITVDSDNELNAAGVPEGFVPIEFNNNLRSVRDGFLQPRPFCSASVKANTAEAHALANVKGIAGGELSYTFKCTIHRGAFLVLKDHATKASFGPNAPFERYMLQHHASWHAFATDDRKLGIRCAKEDLVLVRETMKTSSWTVGAFLGKSTERKRSPLGHKSRQPPRPNSVYLLNIASIITASSAVAPSRRLTSQRSCATRAKDQCIFLNIYKLKHRKLLPTKIVANGERSTPDDRDDGSVGSAGTSVSSADYSVEMDTGNFPVRSPLDDVLDYILENSDADVAIASDADIEAIFAVRPLCDSCFMTRMLQSLSPSLARFINWTYRLLWTGSKAYTNKANCWNKWES